LPNSLADRLRGLGAVGIVALEHDGSTYSPFRQSLALLSTYLDLGANECWLKKPRHLVLQPAKPVLVACVTNELRRYINLSTSSLDPLQRTVALLAQIEPVVLLIDEVSTNPIGPDVFD
jgi:hypothetical protein